MKNMDWGIHCPTPPTHGTVSQPHYLELFFYGVMSSNKASYYRCMPLIKGQYPSLNSRIMPRDQFLSFSVSAIKILSQCHVLVNKWTLDCFLYILLWHPQGWLWYNKLVNRTISYELVGNFISIYPKISGDSQSLTEWWVEMSFNILQHCHTSGDIVVAAWRACKAAWPLEQILMYFSDTIFLFCNNRLR